MTLITGKVLNDQGVELWKTLSDNKTHFGYVWHEGLNEDPLPWNPEGVCSKGGLYFTTIDMLTCYMDRSVWDRSWIGRITVDDDEPVWQEPNGKWKAHRVTLSDVRRIKDLDDRDKYYFLRGIDCLPKYDAANRQEVWVEMLTCYPWFMEFLTDRDMPIVRQIISRDGCFLVYVPKDMRTYELCVVAVKRNWYALKHVPKDKKTYELCMLAVQRDGYALEFVPPAMQTREMCTLAIERDRNALQFVRLEKPGKIYLNAVKRDCWYLQHVPKQHQTRKLVMAALKQNGRLLKDVLVPLTPEMCLAAVEQNGLALEWVEEQTAELCVVAVDQNPEAVEFVDDEFMFLFDDSDDQKKKKKKKLKTKRESHK